MMTTSRWSSVGARHCSTYARKIVPFIGPSITNGATNPVVAQSDNQGDGLPMAVGNGPDQSFAPRATAPKSHQAGAGGGLVDEHQSGGIKQTLLANPAPPCPRHVRPFLLRRAQAFFDGDIMSLEKSPDRSATAWNSLLAHRHNDLVQIGRAHV